MIRTVWDPLWRPVEVSRTLDLSEETSVSVTRPLHETEKIQIEKALAVTEGNRARAAELLGISRATIYRKIREHRISL